ncbi:hypothetical protein ACELLULO517_15690 [Acidisoma cellulosilytica]|uniref:Uncharacterized protein n=1 Tax=Acidisoma cellulosilyticum TaxID=2802395 RepID=A0A963Z451_9PROT|nr:hypothetical protein [Acidisoma cellulosilyticum]MCB8881690.1 hypothetical protein [Acidisoma cellulosilyticum]
MSYADNVSHQMHSTINVGVAGIGLALLAAGRESVERSHIRAAAASTGAREDVLRRTLSDMRTELSHARVALSDVQTERDFLRSQLALVRGQLASAQVDLGLMQEIAAEMAA